MVSRRAAVGLLLLAIGALVVLQGSGAVSALIGERGLDIGTADDHSALLGIDTESVAGGDGERVPIMTLTNRMNEPLDEIEVIPLESGNPDVGLEDVSGPVTLQPGESGIVRATLVCDAEAQNQPVELEISVAGDSDSVTTIREVTVTCDAPSEGPPPGDVYRIDGEPHWLDDREYIFEIVHENVERAEWDFGDGTTSSAHWARHTYDEAGTYEVTVTVVIDGEEYVYTETLDVQTDEPGSDGPPADQVYDIRQEPWLDDREYIFEIVHDDVWSAEWELGDGTTETGHWFRHTYAQDGTYDVTVTVVIDGDEYAYTDSVEVST